jgi:hypothetical protein
MITQILFNIPDPMNSYQQFIRYNHLDIPDMKDDDLQTEFYSLRALLYWLPPDKQWIKERVRELGKEYGRRHYVQNQNQLTVKTSSEPQNKVLRTVDL